MIETNRPTVRAMRPEDAAAVIEMARELAAAVGDPEPRLTEADLLRDGTGPERWFDCLVAEVAGGLVAYAVVCKAFEATPPASACGSATFMSGRKRAATE